MSPPNRGDELLHQTAESLPWQTALLTAAEQGLSPGASDLRPKTLQAGQVARYGVVVEIPPHHPVQPAPHLRHRLMPAPIEGLANLMGQAHISYEQIYYLAAMPNWRFNRDGQNAGRPLS